MFFRHSLWMMPKHKLRIAIHLVRFVPQSRPIIWADTKAYTPLALRVRWTQWRRYLWGIGARVPLGFWKFCGYCSCCQLNCRNFKNHQRKTYIKFSSRPISQHAKPHVNRLKQPWNQREIQGRGEEEEIPVVPPHLISWRRHWVDTSAHLGYDSNAENQQHQRLYC